MNHILSILKGWYYHLINKNILLLKQRLEICELCEEKKTDHLGDYCGACNCTLKLKARLKEEQCPLNKWKV